MKLRVEKVGRDSHAHSYELFWVSENESEQARLPVVRIVNTTVSPFANISRPYSDKALAKLLAAAPRTAEELERVKEELETMKVLRDNAVMNTHNISLKRDEMLWDGMKAEKG